MPQDVAIGSIRRDNRIEPADETPATPSAKTRSGPDLAAIDRDRIRQVLASSLAASTRRAYLGHWDAFKAWSERRGYEPVPAAPETPKQAVPLTATALVWGDIAAEADGSGRLAVHRSKNDQASAEAVQYLGPQAMRDLAAIKPPGLESG